MKSRIVILFIVFCLLWAGLISRALVVQILPNSRLENLQKKQFNKKMQIRSRRGTIFDRNGQKLAVTVSSWSLFADPSSMENHWNVATKLEPLLSIPKRKIYSKLRDPSKRFVWIRRFLGEQDHKKIEKLKIRGLGFIEEPKRVYPYGRLLSQVLGFVGSDGYGLEGIELSFDDILRGKVKSVIVPRDARGRPLLGNVQILKEVADGADIHLSIDSEIQFYLEKELSQVLKSYEADSAIGIVLDANNSEVLAMANSPVFNLNRAKFAEAKIRRNRAVTDAFEQGSTMKSFVLASALQNNVVKPNTKYKIVDGKLKIGKHYIRDAHRREITQRLTVSEIFSKSSNVGFAKIGFDLKAGPLRSTLLQFGFGQRTGIELPGEAKGIVNPLPWRKHLLSNVSFGHGISATALQVANAYAAIANGGTLKKPRIIRSISNSDLGSTENFESEDKHQVVDKKTVNTLTLLLTQVTSNNGSGVNAKIAGFPVAGKTGTAQKVDVKNGGYLKGAYLSSFAGFVPAHDPKYVIFIAVDNAKSQYYGSQVAAPVFARIAQFVVRRAGLQPVLISNENVLAKKTGESANHKNQKRALEKLVEIDWQAGTMPNLVGMSLRKVMKKIKGKDLNIEFRGSGVVAKTWPEFGKTLPINKKIFIRLKEEKSKVIRKGLSK